MDVNNVLSSISQIQFEIVSSSEVLPRGRVVRINNGNGEPLRIQTPLIQTPLIRPGNSSLPNQLNRTDRTISLNLVNQVLNEQLGPTLSETVLDRLRTLSQYRRENANRESANRRNSNRVHHTQLMARRVDIVVQEGQSATNYSELEPGVYNLERVTNNGIFSTKVINYHKYLLSVSNDDLINSYSDKELVCSVCLEQINTKINCKINKLDKSDEPDKSNEPDEVSQLSCKHIFHTNCIKAWLQTKLSCPYCREICKAKLKQDQSTL